MSNFNLFDFAPGAEKPVFSFDPTNLGTPPAQSPRQPTASPWLSRYRADPKISATGRKAMEDDLASGSLTQEQADELIKDIYRRREDERGFIGGAFDKTKEAFQSGVEAMDVTGQKFATGDINFAQAAVRGASQALGTALAPVAGIAGQAFQEATDVETRQNLTQAIAPTAEKIKTWFDEQSPDQQERLRDVFAGTDLLLTFAGGKAATSAVQKAGETATDITQSVSSGIKNVGKKAAALKTGTEDAIESVTEKAAGKVLGSGDGTKELFQAASPSYNTLAKSRDIAAIKDKAKLADQAVVEAGRIPKNTTERVIAYRDAKKEIWDSVSRARKGSVAKFDAAKIADEIDAGIAELSVAGKINPAIEADVNALRRQSEYFRSLGKVDVPTLGNLRTQINAVTDWQPTKQFGDAFDSVMKKAAEATRNAENKIVSSVTGTDISPLLKKYGALSEMYGDVVKQDIKNLRKKGLGIEESFSRIAGLGDVAGGLVQLVSNPSQGIRDLASGGAKIALGKVAGKLKDPDYLISEGYKKLAESIKKASLLKPAVKPKSPALKPKSFDNAGNAKKSVLTPAKNASEQPLRNAGTADAPASIAKEAPKTLKGGFLNKGGYVKLPGSDVKKVDKLNTGDEIVLIRGTGKPMDSATASYSQAYGEGLYLTDDVKTAKYYGPNIKETKIRNSDIFDTENDLLKPKAVSEVIKEVEKVTGRKTTISKSPQTYDRLRRDLYGDMGLDDQEVSKIINSVLKKNGFQGIRYDIGRVNDELSGNAFVIFENKSPVLKPASSK